MWRVLASGGRLLAVVPNRRGLWARMDTTPFGHGRPYSRSQINQLLRETWFTPTGWSEALYVPPVARGWFLRSAVAWERTGATLSAPFAGVHLVEATKQVYRAIPARRDKAPAGAGARAGAGAVAGRRGEVDNGLSLRSIRLTRLVAAVAWHRLRRRALRIGVAEIIRTVRADNRRRRDDAGAGDAPKRSWRSPCSWPFCP